jgi:hypothetical protein
MKNKKSQRFCTKRDTTNQINSLSATANRRTLKTIVITLYITLLLLSTVPFLADRIIEPKMQEKYEHHLIFEADGYQSHYYVERADTNSVGKIDLIYITATNALLVNAVNIKVLHIDCRSLYSEECTSVYGIDPTDNSNYYKWYFSEKNHLNVNIDSDTTISDLTFLDTPVPHKVVVNGIQWYEGTDYDYSEESYLVLSNVPSGQSVADVYFKSDSKLGPRAILQVSNRLVRVKESILFDASKSFDLDGSIVAYTIDFGDGSFYSSDKQMHYYSGPGVYGAILTVRDNDYLIDRAYVNITVVSTSDIPEIIGTVPDQNRRTHRHGH